MIRKIDSISNVRKIVLVSSAFYPEISPRSFRATELAKEFFRQGHCVTVISKQRDFDYTEFLKNFPIEFKTWDKTFYSRIPIIKRKPFSIVSRLVIRVLGILFEYPGIEEMFLVRKVLKDKEGYDLLISFAVPFPVHWGVAKVWSEKRPIAKTWVADCGDPFMFNRLDTFRKPFYFKYFELDFCRKCDYITIPYKELKDKFYQEFSSKVVIIPQGFDFSEVRIFTPPLQNDRPTFIFAGSILPGKRDLAKFFDFLSTVTKDFLFIVYTNQKDWFKKYEEIFAEKLEIRDYIDRLSLIYEMSKADFLVNVDTILDVNDNIEAVPSKLIDYALSNRPILNISTECQDTNKVKEFLNGVYDRQRIIEISNYDIRKVSLKFLELLNE